MSDARPKEAGVLVDAAALVGVLTLWITVGLFAYGQGKADRSSDAKQVTTAAGIEFAVPPELAGSQTPTGVLEALAITPLRVYSPAGNTTQGSVVVGYSRGTLAAPTARLAASSTTQVDELGEYVAVRVTGTVGNAGVRNRVIIYSVPTTGGDAVVLCLAARDGVVTARQPDCERVATKLKIAPNSSIGRPIPLGQLETYPNALLKQFSSYADEASGLRLRLKEARFSGEERSLTAQLAALYARAARALAQPNPDPLVSPGQSLLHTSVLRVLAGYNLLARAAASNDLRAWAQGRIQVAGAEGTIAVALRRILTE